MQLHSMAMLPGSMTCTRRVPHRTPEGCGQQPRDSNCEPRPEKAIYKALGWTQIPSCTLSQSMSDWNVLCQLLKAANLLNGCNLEEDRLGLLPSICQVS